MDQILAPKRAAPVKAQVFVCIDCGEEFGFTAEAKAHFAKLGFTADPKRCKSCHQTHKQRQQKIF